MIGHTNLLPPSCRERFETQRLRRRWMLAYCCTCVGLAVLYSASANAFSRVDRTRDTLRAEVQDRLLQDKQATGLLEEITTVEGRLTRYNNLAWPVRMSEAIASIGPIIPETSTLTSLTLAPTVERTRIPAKKGKAAEEKVERYLTVEIQGVSQSDLDVSSIVSGLDANPLFRAVAIDFARPRDVDGVDAREFRIQAEIDLEARYIFNDLAEVATP